MTRNGSTACADATDAQLRDIAGSDLAEILRGQLAEANRGCRRDEIEDAIQAAYLAAETAREPFTDRGALYRWLRTAAEYRISRARRNVRREVLVEPGDEEVEQRIGVGPSAEEQVIELERERQRRQLVDAILPALSDRQRDVLALHVRDYKRPQIASRLGLSRRVVQRELESVMRIARHEVGQLAGGGCTSGEALVLRRACGLASPIESVRAHSHIAECDECQGFADRLDVWRDLAAALPVPAAGAQADSGRFAEGFAALRQHVADAASSAKQQAVGAYYRTADPTPLTGARPGAAAAVIASCLTIGTAGVCVTQGVAPWTAATGLIASEPERKPDPPRQPPPTPAPEAPQVDPSTPAPTPAPAPQVTPAPKPEPPPPPAPPEADVEPSSPSYASSSTSSSGSSSSAPTAPAPSAADAEFGGP